MNSIKLTANYANLSNTFINGTNITVGKVFLGIFLTSLFCTTILGNMLVIIAVVIHRQLRSITNFFIVSLASADLLMGVIVMPFAAYSELSDGHWAFGKHWCDLWHAIDILSSTASILHLCMIALERFWATSSPLTYGISKKRCAVMIGLAWALSAMISLPGIAWWHAMEARQNRTSNSTTICQFPNDKSYILVSSAVSFYIPLVVMIVVYFRIYRTATRVMKTLSTGTKVVYKDAQSGQVLRLGVHRGGATSNGPPANHYTSSQYSRVIDHHNQNNNHQNIQQESVIRKKAFLCFRYKLKKLSNVEGFKVSFDRRYSPIHLVSNSEPSTFSSPSFQAIDIAASNTMAASDSISSNQSSPPSNSDQLTHDYSCHQFSCYKPRHHHHHYNSRRKVRHYRKNPRLPFSSSFSSTSSSYHHRSARPQLTPASRPRYKRTISLSLGRKFRKFATEQKAAKTLGIVMGIFIICWLPFFICNVLTATYPSAFGSSYNHNITMTIVTWLGYLNSAINPIIYAHSLRDFRRAFIHLLCCACGVVSSKIGGSVNLRRTCCGCVPYGGAGVDVSISGVGGYYVGPGGTRGGHTPVSSIKRHKSSGNSSTNYNNTQRYFQHTPHLKY